MDPCRSPGSWSSPCTTRMAATTGPPMPAPAARGDFLTAPELHPIFGEMLARAVEGAWAALVSTRPVRLSTSTAQAKAPWRSRCSPRSRRASDTPRSKSTTAGSLRFAIGWSRPDWPNGSSRHGRRPTGLVIANEVLDALPVHRVKRRGPSLRELAVEEVAGRRVRRGRGRAPPRPRWPLDWPTRASTSSTVRQPRSASSSTLGSPQPPNHSAAGSSCVIDYGYPAAELYDPVRRRDGTLRAYIRHQASDDPYSNVGRQDLTAHVDVTAVERGHTPSIRYRQKRQKGTVKVAIKPDGSFMTKIKRR